MSFEFFFGLFGLISCDSASRHKLRLDNDWRLSTPLGAHLFRADAANLNINQGLKSGNLAGAGGATAANAKAAAAAAAAATSNTTGSPAPTTLSAHSLKPQSVFSTTSPSLIGSKATDKINSGSGDGSSASSVASSPIGSTTSGSTSNSQAAFIEPTTASLSSTVSAPRNRTRRLRVAYCWIICLSLWVQAGRIIVGLIVDRSPLTLDFFCLGANRIHFLIPTLCLAIQAAAVSTIFIRNNDETNWLVPFCSSKDYLIRSRSNFKPKIETYRRRVNISIGFALILALASSISLSAYVFHSVTDSELTRSTLSDSTLDQAAAAAAANTALVSSSSTQQPPAGQSGSNQASAAADQQPKQFKQWERAVCMVLLVLDLIWAVYSTYICFLVSFYFNLICSIMKARFHSISKVIEDLAESNATKTMNQARKITTLYLEHNEACELLDESNDFWQYLIFFTYFTYIPAYCYCLYNLFFVDFDAWPSFMTWIIHTHTGFIILLISFSAAGVSTEAHAPYTSLHTLSLIQLPLDVEVNIATFLHRVRGLTIGYSCYDLFAITNASMSNTAAACASYFLIVADFSRSSVFTLAQMNSSASAATATPAGGAPAQG